MSVAVPELLLYDRNRPTRIGIPEAGFCLNKLVDDVVEIAARLSGAGVGPRGLSSSCGVFGENGLEFGRGCSMQDHAVRAKVELSAHGIDALAG
jgi:hypothetical protein